jgi:hypothetical protein
MIAIRLIKGFPLSTFNVCDGRLHDAARDKFDSPCGLIRVLPSRCSKRFPMLFDSEPARHHTSSSVNVSMQLSIFGK